ncbi:ECF transporter S component [Candidatus Fermentibacteria bacterium]|nr:ECF transporter S component [Candidatus Fermentibacteria bacterium]
MRHSAREVAIGGLFLALALALPPLFHLMGLGSVFLPMLLPVLSLGFLSAWRIAATVGFLAPLISGLITGMPPFVPPSAFMMMVELSLLGLVPSLLYRRLRWNFWVVLTLTLVLNRGVVFLLRFIVAEFFSIPGIAYSLFIVTAGLPGIVLMLVATPLIVRTIERRMGSPA